jgi:translation initiation factor eIF-2B subunit delta
MSETPATEVAPAPAPAESAPPTQESASASTNGNAADAPKKLSPAELKKQKQAEKQAKRAQAKTASGASNQQQGASKDGQKQTSKDDKSRPLAARRRPSQTNAPAVKEPEKKAKKEKEKEKKDEEPKQTGLFFGHLYSQPKQQSLVGASKDVHPAVLALGLQYSSYAICGSTARMVAMLLVFKTVIEAYQTPPGNSLARHLTGHYLGPQIEFLKSCRPLSISMGNAIRWLKDSKLASRVRIRTEAARMLIARIR